VTFNDEDLVGIRYFTKEEWQKRKDHLYSLETIETIYHNDCDWYYDSADDLLSHYTVEYVDTMFETNDSRFLDPMIAESYERDEYEE